MLGNVPAWWARVVVVMHPMGWILLGFIDGVKRWDLGHDKTPLWLNYVVVNNQPGAVRTGVRWPPMVSGTAGKAKGR
jgi:hypothetical protein